MNLTSGSSRLKGLRRHCALTTPRRRQGQAVWQGNGTPGLPGARSTPQDRGFSPCLLHDEPSESQLHNLLRTKTEAPGRWRALGLPTGTGSSSSAPSSPPVPWGQRWGPAAPR